MRCDFGERAVVDRQHHDYREQADHDRVELNHEAVGRLGLMKVAL